MFCTNCGKEVDNDTLFCPYCGYRQTIDNICEDEWFCIIDNERRGPYKVDKILLEANQGNITRETLVSKKGMENWIPAGQSPIAYIFKSTVPVMPSGVVDNKFVWALATVPLLVSWFIEVFFDVSWLVTVVTIILNVVFLSLDIKALEKSEKNAESWLWLGVVLVPVYLFIRASKTDKQYGYAIAWCLMFLADLLII